MVRRRSPRCSAERTVPTSVTIPVNIGVRLAVPHPLVNFEPVDAEALFPDQFPPAVGVGNGVEADIAEARLALADDDRGAVDQDPVDQIFAEEGGRRRRPAFDQQLVDVMKSRYIPRTPK